jgi:hypothetical protein
MWTREDPTEAPQAACCGVAEGDVKPLRFSMRHAGLSLRRFVAEMKRLLQGQSSLMWVATNTSDASIPSTSAALSSFALR